MNDDYQHYLRLIADKNTTPPELVNSFVQEAVGDSPKVKTRIMAGEVNEVYNVITTAGERVIVRIGRGMTPKFGQEKWAIDQCAAQGIPVPTIRLIKHIPQSDGLLSVCVQDWLPGDTMERGNIDYWDMPDDQVRDLFRQSGELLAMIHTIKVEGFGDLNSQGHGKFSTFTNLMLEKPGQQEEFMKMAQELGIPRANIRRALQLMASEGKRIAVTKPVLNHGDFCGKHIMHDNNLVTGIIDFGDVLGESPAFDLARWEYWFGNNKYFVWLKEGYTNKAIFNDGFDDLSRLIQLDINLGTIWWYAQEKYDRGIKEGVDKLKELLDYYLR